MRFHRLVAAVALIALVAGHAWNTCVGWQPTAAMRAACCDAADHAREGINADACCASGERQQHAYPSVSALPPALSPTVAIASLLARPPERVTFVEHGVRGFARGVPTHLLLSVFLV